MHNFFDFSSKYSSTTVQAHPVGLDVATHQSELFDHHRLILGDYNGIHFPIIFQQDHGSKLQDILNTGHVSLLLISDKMKNFLELNNLTGWKTFPIQFLDKKGSEILGYHGFSITGRCGPIDYAKSELIEKLVPATPPFFLRKFYKGLYVGLDRWDGTDFFVPEGVLHIIITESASNVLKKNKLTNIYLKNLLEIETPENDIKILNS